MDVNSKVTSKQTILIEADGTVSINFDSRTLVNADAALLTQFNI